MNLTNDKGIMLDVTTLGKAIMCARDMPMSKNTEREKFKAITLDKWAAEASKNK